MTWSRSFAGQKDEVLRQIREAQDIPPIAVDALRATIDSLTAGTHYSVSTSGHHSDTSFQHDMNVYMQPRAQRAPVV